MIVFTSETAEIDRNTSRYGHLSATLLHYYVQGEQGAGLERSGFPVSGDLLHVLNLANERDPDTQLDIGHETREEDHQ